MGNVSCTFYAPCPKAFLGSMGTCHRIEGELLKLPHIVIEYREEESFSPGKVSPSLIAGFGLHWTWVYFFMLNGSSTIYPDAPGMQAALFPVSLIFFIATFLCYGMFLSPMRALFATRHKRARNRAVAAGLVFVSMLLAIAGNAAPDISMQLGVVSGMLNGVGSSVLLMSYGASFSVCDLPAIAICAALSLPISVGGFAALVLGNAFAAPFGTVACLALPFVELLCLHACSHRLTDQLEFTSMTMPVRRAPFALRIMAPAAVFGFILGIMRTRSSLMPANTESTGDMAIAMILAGVFACVVAIIAMLTQRQTSNFSFRTLMPVSAVLIASLALPDNSDIYVTFCLFGSYLMLEMCLWVLFSDISQRFRISPFTAFGFGRGFMALGTFLGYLATMPGAPLHSVMTDMGALIALSLVFITLGVSFVPTYAELRSTLMRGHQCPAIVHEDEQRLHFAEDEKDAPTTEANEAAEDEESDLPASEEVEASLPPSIPNPESNGDAGLAAKPSPEETARQAAGRFKRKCAIVADRYLLSHKETEVLYLLAKGHKSAVIQERLFISEGTANTHMRHIYRKLDVHSQSELMSLVESEHVEESSW